MPPAGAFEANISVMSKSNLRVGHNIKMQGRDLENEIILSII